MEEGWAGWGLGKRYCEGGGGVDGAEGGEGWEGFLIGKGMAYANVQGLLRRCLWSQGCHRDFEPVYNITDMHGILLSFVLEKHEIRRVSIHLFV